MRAHTSKLMSYLEAIVSFVVLNPEKLVIFFLLWFVGFFLIVFRFKYTMF